MAYVIVGLGNPEPEYEHTRHNAGRLAVLRMQEAWGFPEFTLRKAAHARVSEGRLGSEKVILVLPELSMNISGKAVHAFVKSAKAAEQLLLVRDELDLPLGLMKMTIARGSGGHKGVESVARAVKSKAFAQLKLGISGQSAKGVLKKPGAGEPVVKHVLGKWKPTEEKTLAQVLTKTVSAAQAFIEEGAPRALLIANTR